MINNFNFKIFKILLVLLVVFTVCVGFARIFGAPKIRAQSDSPTPESENIKPFLIDTDVDGLTDDAEINKYKTDPFVWDTDKDGYSDSQEVMIKSNPLDAAVTPETVSESNPDIPFAWYVSRASGIAAFILFSIGVCFGMSISSKSYFKILKPPVALETHNSISIVAIFATILHAGSLFFDSYFKLSFLEAAVPFYIDRSFKSAMGFDFKVAIALGIISLYLIIILIVTSEFRSKMSIKLWRALHFLSFPAYFLFLGHGFISGTDSKETWMTAIYMISAAAFIIMFVVRIISVIRLSKAKKLRLAQKAALAAQVSPAPQVEQVTQISVPPIMDNTSSMPTLAGTNFSEINLK